MNRSQVFFGFTLFAVSLFGVLARADEVTKPPHSRAMFVLVDFTCERLEDEKWVIVDLAKEGIWSDDLLRFTPILEPNDRSNVKSVRVLRRPIDMPKAPWKELSRSKLGNAFVETSLGSGDWSIDMEVTFKDGTSARLAKDGK